MTPGGLLRKCWHRWRAQKLRLSGAQVGAGCQIRSGVTARCGVRDSRRGQIVIENNVVLQDGVILEGYGGAIRIGQSTFIGPYTVIYGQGGVEIGDHCLIAAHCQIVSANHVVPPLGTDMRFLTDELLPTKIGRDVWLGAGVTILGGVTVGHGCVIGAGAVVTRDLPPGAIALGVPATIKSYREGASSPPS